MRGLWYSYLSRAIPCRPKPLPDELFSSWILRIALHSGMKPQSFCQMMWPNKPFWNRSLDRSADQDLVNCLSIVTGTEIARIQQTLLTDFEGLLFPRMVRNGNTRWILPLAIYHRTHLRSGLSFCPKCLSAEEPYFRRSWRLSLSTVCQLHRCVLFDACHICRVPIQPHRIEMGNRSPYTSKPLFLCAQCGSDLRAQTTVKAETAQLTHESRSALIMQSGKFEDGLSLEYFSVLGHVLRLLATRTKRAQPLREIVASESSCGKIRKWQNHLKWLTFDAMRIEDRRQFLGAAYWLLDDWPYRFRSLCRAANLRPSDLLRDFGDAPTWYIRATALSLSE
jgi:hypothetical protein